MQMGVCFNLVKKLLLNREGSFAVNFALIAPVLLALGATAVDFTAYGKQKSAMQAAADAAALAAVREASLKGWTSTIADAVADAVVDANYTNTNAQDTYHSVSTSTDQTNRKITVTVEQDHYPYFTASLFPSPQIQVTSTATAAGSTNICVIGLHDNQAETVGLNDEALLTAPNCAVYSNSTALDSITATEISKLTAELTCSAGGARSSLANFTNEPVTNCPKIADPLSARPAPDFGPSCDHTNFSLKGKKASTTISPGVYCGGITLGANVAVTLDKGVYIIKDGPLSLGSNASLYGRGAGFYFTGDDAEFELQSGSTVDLEAPETGALAGLLFYQEHGANEANFLLRSNKASTLVGTIYLPNGNFIIDTNSKVADASAYTAIVSRTLTLKRGPNVVLNTDYGATTVPVPAGIGSQNGTVRLLN